VHLSREIGVHASDIMIRESAGIIYASTSVDGAMGCKPESARHVTKFDRDFEKEPN
jgi:hypothetical protein